MGDGMYFHRVNSMTATRVWINNPTRRQARDAIAAGACGCTANPSYLSKMLQDPEERPYIREIILELLPQESDDLKLLEKLQSRVVKGLAEIFYPLYQQSHGKYGFVSIQGDPFLETEENIYRYAKTNHAMSANITPKIPLVEDAFGAIRKLMAEGVPLNITEVMSVHQFIDLLQIYDEVSKTQETMPEIFCSHIMGIFNEYMQEYTQREGIRIERDVLRQAGGAVARKLTELGQERLSPIRWISGGARSVSDFTGLVGSNMNVTINWPGTFDVLLESDPPVQQVFAHPIPLSVVDELLEKLPEFRKAYMMQGIETKDYDDYGPVVKFRSSFQKGWKEALKEIAKMRAEK